MQLGSTEEVVKRLLGWYREHARDLPWRRTIDPYAIWISEIMLQQTQVKTVVPYWQKWMTALPNVAALAAAKIDRVLKLWEGLGYYSRARNLHKAARLLVEQHDGIFPGTFAELIELPGIGRYTSGAICSIAFDQPIAVLDGNVVRVLARLYAVRGNPKERRTNEALWKLAERLVVAADRERVNGERPCADLNQALMELGATICTPVAPTCASCPVQESCLGLARRCVHRLPERTKRAPNAARRFVAVVVQHGRKFFVRKRPAGVVNAHLWEFPNLEVRAKGRIRPALRTLAGSAAALPFHRIKHTITRYRITLDVFKADARSPAEYDQGEWRSLGQLQRLAFSSAHRRILDHLIKSRRS